MKFLIARLSEFSDFKNFFLTGRFLNIFSILISVPTFPFDGFILNNLPNITFNS